MMKVKWTLQWLFVSIILGLDYLQKISATPNEGAVSYIPALECYDPYGKPQVKINSKSFCLYAIWPVIFFFIFSVIYAWQAQKLLNRLEQIENVHYNFHIHLVSAFMKFSKNAISTFVSFFVFFFILFPPILFFNCIFTPRCTHIIMIIFWYCW